MGTIEWDKEKYKDCLYLTPEQLLGKVKLKDILTKIKSEKIKVLNATVLDYLMEHQDQIPEEWKGDNKIGESKYIFFLGTIFGKFNKTPYVRYLYWFGNSWQSAGEHELESSMYSRTHIAILAK